METDGLFIQNIEAGNYNLTVKKKGYASKLVHISVISNKTIEIEIEIDRLEKEKSYIRTDGYYVAKTKWTYLEGGLFSRQYRPYIVFVFTNIESGKFNRLVWFPVNTYDRQKKNENSLHDNINECLELGFEEIKNRVNTSGSYKIEKVNDYNNELYFRCSMEELTMKGKVIQREFKNSFSVNIESSSWDNSKRKWIDETYNLDFIFHPYNFE